LNLLVQDIGFEDEDIIVAKSSNAADAKFDLIIGTIEDIIMGIYLKCFKDYHTIKLKFILFFRNTISRNTRSIHEQKLQTF
jgi:hypothetical protein